MWREQGERYVVSGKNLALPFMGNSTPWSLGVDGSAADTQHDYRFLFTRTGSDTFRPLTGLII